jgi:hypothetical protein
MTDRIPFAPRRGRQSAAVILGALLTLGLAACEVPTELPKWDTTWVVPADSTTIGVSSLLPSSVTTTSNGSAFLLNVQPLSFTQTLGQLCGAGCNGLQGSTVPKPAFTNTVSSEIALPNDVVSVKDGQVAVTLSHDFSFDPLRPAPGQYGYILVTATSGSTVLASDSLPGQSLDFPAGLVRTRNLTLNGTISGPITVSVKTFSPAGGTVNVDLSDRLAVGTPAQIQFSQSQIRVSNRAINTSDVELDLGDIDEDVSSRTKAGALLLTLSNPFAVTGNLSLVITAAGTTITKPVALAQGTTSARVDFNLQEIQAILGTSPVKLKVGGAVCASASCTTTVSPSQTVTIASRLSLTIGPKEEN